MLSKDEERKYHAIVARAWTDKAFHDHFVKNPRQVLKEHGIDVPDRVDVAVKEGAAKGRVEFGLPPRPPGLSDDDIKNASDDDPDTCAF